VRDIVVVAILLGSVPAILVWPYYGILLWFWVGIFTPHRWAYGFSRSLPAALCVAVPTMVGAVFAKKNKHIFTREMILLLLLWGWFALTVYHATTVPTFGSHVHMAEDKLIEISKILLMTVMAVVLVRTTAQLKVLFMVVGVSLGALAVKGGLFGILTGGAYRVFGTPDSYIADNNDFALALNMALGILFFTRRDTTNKWARFAFLVLFLASVLCVILSYSRGGLLGLIAVSSLLAVKAKRKLVGVALLATVTMALITFAPAAWQSRMDNLFAGHLDGSAEQRLASWAFAWNFAGHYPVTGGGFECFTPEQFQVYATRRMPGDFASSGPHSIYFQVLAEQGFTGFFLFYSLVASCVFRAYSIRRKARRDPRLVVLIPYTHMIELGLAGYVVSGAFLGRAYFDLYFFLVAATISTTLIAKRLASTPIRVEEQVEELPDENGVLATVGRSA